MGQFKILKTQSKRHAIELSFKVQVSPDHPTSKHKLECFFFYYFRGPFENLTGLKMEFPITNCPNRWEILSDDLVPYCLQGSTRITDITNQMSSMIKLLERTKIYDYFNLKGKNSVILPNKI